MAEHSTKSHDGAAKRVFQKTSKKQQRSEKFKKHLGSSVEGQGFADKRKKKIQFEYLKLLKKEKLQKGRQEPTQTTSAGTNPAFRNKTHSTKGLSAFSGLVKKQKVEKKNAQKQKEEAEKRQEEREVKIQASRKKRKQNYKLLCKRTSKGQPVMRTQMEFLLSKIEKQINQT